MKRSNCKVLATLLTMLMLITMSSTFAYAADPDGQTVGGAMLAPVVEETTTEPVVIGKVNAIEVRGNLRVDVNTIRNAMKTKVGDIVTEDDIMMDIENLANLGWFTNVYPDFTGLLDGVRYIIFVEEFPRLDNILISGNTLLDSNEIISKLKSEIGRIININTVYEDVDKVSEIYSDKGYIVMVEPTLSSNGSDLIFNVVELRVGEVGISGNVKTKSDILLAELKVKKGDFLVMKNLEEDVRMLYMTEAFEAPTEETVKISLIPGTNEVAVLYELVEAKSGSANTGITFSISEGLTGYLELGSTNLFGRLEKASIKASLSNTSIDYEIEYNMPWFINSKNSLGFSLGSTQFESKSTDPAHINGTSQRIALAGRNTGGSVTYGRALNVNTRLMASLSLNYSYPRVKNRADEEAVLAQIGDTESLQNTVTTSLGISLVHDMRNNITAATSGYRLTASIEGGLVYYPGYKDNANKDSLGTYVKIGGSASIYHELFAKNVLAARISAWTTVKPLIPRQKYSLGGSESVRGYDFGAMSGDNMVFINIENRYNIVENFDIVAFFDVGYAWDMGSYLDFSNILYGYGIGVRIGVPFLGTIRLDYAFNKYGKGQPSFSFGHMF